MVAGMKKLNEMSIGRTDDPENPFRGTSFEAASLPVVESQTPSGPGGHGVSRRPDT